MKTAKRVLAILMAMLMAVSTLAVAASAAESIASQLASGNTASISKNTRESVVITKDATIDLGGKILKGVPGSPAITVKNGATVTIKNGYVESYFYNYSGVNSTTFETLKKIGQSPAGIQASGTRTTVILEDVRVLGGLLRIPQQTEWYVPTGSAVKIYGGAKVQLNGAVLIGSYAVSDDPAKTGHPDGTVEVTEAIMIGYIDLLRTGGEGGGAVQYNHKTVEMVNAADRVEGYLNGNINLTDGERKILKDIVMDDRVFIFTKKPTDDKAIVTIDENGGATVKAEEIKHFRTTDCSYKYVPLYAFDAETGKKFNFTDTYLNSELRDKDIRVKYRLEFQLKGDVKEFANNFDYYFDLDWAIKQVDKAYDAAMNEYQTQVIEPLADLYKRIVAAANSPMKDADDQPLHDEHGHTYSLAGQFPDEYYAILRALLSIGGVTMYNAAEDPEVFTTSRFEVGEPLYDNGTKKPANVVLGEPLDEQNYVPNDPNNWSAGGHWETIYKVKELGLLDRIDTMIKEFNEKRDGSFTKQQNWDKLAHYVVDNYEKVINLVAEAERTFADVKRDLTSGAVGQAVEQLDMATELRTLDNIINGLHKVNTEIANLRANNEMVRSVESKIKDNANNGTIESYLSKAKRLVNDYRTYFTPKDFLDGEDFGKAYTVDGLTKQRIIPKAKLNLSVLGAGTVTYTPDTVEGGVADYYEDVTRIPYTSYVTLTAVPDDADNEFLYYRDAFTQRIMSTNPVYVVDTQISRYIQAVFESTEKSLVVFTNTSGVIVNDSKEFMEGLDASSIVPPAFTGYQMVGWGPNGTYTLGSADFTSSYLVGNSAFEGGAVYKITGFAFPINSTTGNKYIVMPKLTANTKNTVTYHDGDNVWSQEVKFGEYATYTAQGDGFKYWADAPENGKVLSVYRTYRFQPVTETNAYAIYEGTAPANGVVNIVAAVEEDTRVRVYVERSIPADRQILSAGTLISYTSDVTVPTAADVNDTTVQGKYTTKRTNEGLLVSSVMYSDMQSSHVAYARGFVELKTETGSEYVYSDVYPVTH